MEVPCARVQAVKRLVYISKLLCFSLIDVSARGCVAMEDDQFGSAILTLYLSSSHGPC